MFAYIVIVVFSCAAVEQLCRGEVKLFVFYLCSALINWSVLK